METRLIIAYALIAVMAGAFVAGVWLMATRARRQRWRERGHKVRGRAPSAPHPDPPARE